nr:MAG TPA: helix-turn-helix domain protein [Caudoviricetes sp.]
MIMREWLKDLREEKQFTQQNVADMLGISKQYYQLIEAHERQKKMDITLMTKLSEIFDVSFNEIIEQEKALTEKIEYNESLVN